MRFAPVHHTKRSLSQTFEGSGSAAAPNLADVLKVLQVVLKNQAQIFEAIHEIKGNQAQQNQLIAGIGFALAFTLDPTGNACQSITAGATAVNGASNFS